MYCVYMYCVVVLTEYHRSVANIRKKTNFLYEQNHLITHQRQNAGLPMAPKLKSVSERKINMKEVIKQELKMANVMSTVVFVF